MNDFLDSMGLLETMYYLVVDPIVGLIPSRGDKLTVKVTADNNANLLFSLSGKKVEYTSCKGFMVSDNGRRMQIRSTHGDYVANIDYSGKTVRYSHVSKLPGLNVTLTSPRDIVVSPGILFTKTKSTIAGRLWTTVVVNE
jgi:hypothetical protein